MAPFAQFSDESPGQERQDMAFKARELAAKWTCFNNSALTRRRKQPDTTLTTPSPQEQPATSKTRATPPPPATPFRATTTTTIDTRSMATTKLGALFLALPLELREEILLYTMLPLPPLSTASIPNTPDNLIIPAIAQVCRSLRSEALGVFFRNRPLEIALYSAANERLTEMWLQRWTQGGRVWRDVTFTGTVTNSGRIHRKDYAFGSFRVGIAVVCGRGGAAGRYAVSAAPGASAEVRKGLEVMKAEVEGWLKKRELAGEKDGFSGGELKELVGIVLRAAVVRGPEW